MKFDFDELTIKKQRRYKKKRMMRHENTGIDTETFEGKARLVCDSFGRAKLLENFDDVIAFLTYRGFKNKFNWFFNIRFDMEALIKHLPLETLRELHTVGSIDYGYYSVQYLSQKFLKIRDNIREESYCFYDINNFLSTSLNQASKEYLGKEKYDKIDSVRLNIDIDYWKENEEEIIHYCKIDAQLTKEVADYFWNLIDEHIHFLPSAPYSKGAYSQEYFLQTTNMPTINSLPIEVLKSAYLSYSGGRFEILKRGYFDKVYLYDINSAYPYQMASLPNYNYGEWFETDEFKPNCLSGFYYCTIEHLHPLISPFMQKISGLNVYPNGKFNQWMTQKEVEFVLSRFPNTDLSVSLGYYFEENNLVYPLREKILELYKWKETEKDPVIRYCVKIILNSLYGKFIQTVGGKTGKIFNPIWAAEITANTRLQLLEVAMKNPSTVIGFSTDSIHSQIPMVFKNPEFCGTNLGQFELDCQGEGIYIQSDVYSIKNEEKTKTRYRGFNLEKMDNIEELKQEYSLSEKQKLSLYEVLKSIQGKTEFKYINSRPIHLGEILAQSKKRDLTQLNVWESVEKLIKINGDSKRIWDRNFINGRDALENNISSTPVYL